MRSKYSCFSSLVLAFALAGCDSPDSFQLTSGDPPLSEGGGAVARLQFKMGQVGEIAARSMTGSPYRIEIRFLEILSDGSETGRIQSDTLVIPRIGVLSKDYRFEPGTRWRVAAKVRDEAGLETHSGKAEFEVEPNRSVNVPLVLAASYSVGRIRVPVIDSMTRFVMKIDGETMVDFAVDKQSRVGEILAFDIDRISASEVGEVGMFEIAVIGEMWGRSWTLYRMQDTVRIYSGGMSSLRLGLAWVGPTAPPASGANLLIEFGRPTTVDGEIFYRDTVGLVRGEGTFTDPRTGHAYPYNRFGRQTWMMRNIGFECFDEAGEFPYPAGDCEYGTLFTDTADSMKMYVQEPPQVPALDFRDACPVGWHVPDTSEWHELVRFASGGESDSVGAYRLRAQIGWYGYHPATSLPGKGWVPVSFNGSDEFGFGLHPTQWYRDGYGNRKWHEAEMFTSTPGCRVAIFDEQGFKACRDFHFEYFYPMTTYAGAVRCIKDPD